MILKIKILCFLFNFLPQISAKIVHLPDGRIFNVPSPDIYKYDLFPESPSSLERLYVFSEENLDTSFLCPKKYFIHEIHQELVTNNVTQLESGLSKIHYASVQKYEDDYERAPCPALYYCLGYQACIYKFNYRICQWDLQNIERVLLVNIVCLRDDINPLTLSLRRQKDYVLHLHYKNELNEDGKFLGNFQNVELPEKSVFSTNCTFKSLDKNFGYFGQCTETPSPSMLGEMWKSLGRSKSHRCLKELKHVLCAYQRNKKGLCIPSLFQQKNSSHMFNFRSLPEVNTRLSSKNYDDFLDKNEAILVPVRLAFFILVTQDITAAMNLLQTIYRKQFLYVLHVDDKLNINIEDLQSLLNSRFSRHNVFLLSPQRTFSAFKSSYETVRAELEGFEELLRLGVWDFVINLNDEDRCLRSVDDLAFALAPHRGLSFLAFMRLLDLKELNRSSETVNYTVFHSCGGDIYNLSFMSEMPDEELKIYAGSKQGVYSRKFIEYLVNEKLRSPTINIYQFHLQTHPLSHEIYVPTVLMNSPFRNSLKIASILISKELINTNYKGCNNTFVLSCKDKEYFSEENIPDLLSLSHRSFFAGKFATDITNSMRDITTGLAVGNYYEFFEAFLLSPVLKILSLTTISNFNTNKAFAKDNIFQFVQKLCITPSLVPHDACCDSKFIAEFNGIVDYNYWIDVSLFNRKNNSLKSARLMLEV